MPANQQAPWFIVHFCVSILLLYIHQMHPFLLHVGSKVSAKWKRRGMGAEPAAQR